MRNTISRQIKKIFDNWYVPVTQDYSITELKYAVGATVPATNA
jgi:hypothetical protein